MNIKESFSVYPPEKFAARTSSELAFLRATYRKIAGDGSIHAQWLTDNFYMLEREGRMVIRALSVKRRVPCSDGFSRLFERFYTLSDLENGELSEEKANKILSEECKIRALSTSELDLLPWLIRAVLISHACRALKSNEENDVLGNSIRSLRNLSEYDFESILEKYNIVEEIFSRDPNGVYRNMDRPSRARYREKLSQIAQKEGISEEKMAEIILKKAQNGVNEREKHIGFYLLEEGDYAPPVSKGTLFLSLQAVIPLVFSLLFCIIFGGWLLLPIIWIVSWEFLRPIISTFQPKLEPRALPRIETNGSIPDDAPTAVVVSNLLPPAKKAAELSERLENLYLTNGKGNIIFGILADFKGADSPTLPEDRSAVSAATRAVSDLNKKYGNRFFLIVRERSFSKTQNSYSGWERKRGAITELIRYIKGENIRFEVFEGNRSKLRNIRYLIALDADTRLLLRTAPELIATAIHPLNRPVIDLEEGRVTKGYGILAPKIGTDLISAGKSAFSRIMTGVRGISPYGGVSSDVYQDFFGSSIFSGKGVINVDAFYMLMDKAFPDEQVLSHDILEGSILRTAFVSDIEMIDGVPSGASSWLSRQHRWIRGDWQNLKWAASMKKLGALGRYQLFDNIRRSLNEPLSFILLIFSMLFNPVTAAAMAALSLLSIAVSGWYSAIRALLAGGPDMFSRRYYSSVMSDARSGFARGFLSLVLLPAWAIMAVDAIIRAVWRQYISGRNLLEWTTAADLGQKSKASEILKKVLPSILIGVILFGIGTTWLHRLVGGVFVCCFLVFTLLSEPRSSSVKKLEKKNLETVYSWAAAMWHFYEEYCTAGDHYLPPDNVQEAPVSRIAHRTSPTNIGLYLISALAARDFGFIDTEEFAARIEKTLETIEKLPKWNGNLYNWYNTRTLSILNPAYVSAVDSGNFAVNLVALKEGLLELKLSELAARCDAILEKLDLRPFYNERRKLFHIGYDCEKGELSNSFYDLLMSEARSMSYYAVAKGQVSAKHWGALGRILARMGGHLGAVSWTGTMFEYYMPQLFLPVFEGSLCFESLRFAQHCQQHRAEIWNIPWGISESGFFAFDGDLNYQYKAHGVQKLGLKRGLDNDLVISPYSSFLLLPFAPETAISNLKRLEKIGMTGRCGFFEAADYTRSRRGMRPFMSVRSYMAHHVGMSIVACANAAFENKMQQRFMRDKEMHSAIELLEERVPSGAIVFEDEIRREVPEKPGRRPRQIEGLRSPEPSAPKTHLLANGEWTLACSDTGVSKSIFRNIDITVDSNDLLRRPNGFFAVIDTNAGAYGITSAPDYAPNIQRRVEFAPDYIAHYASAHGIEGMMKSSVHASLPCEERRIILKNQNSKHTSAKLLLYFEPSLTEKNAYLSHPAFSKLFIEPTFDKTANALIFEKRPRSGEEPLFLAVGFSDIKFEYDTSRERILTRPYGILSLLDASEKKFQKTVGIPDPCFSARFSVKLAPKEEFETSVWLCAASSQSEALRILALSRGGRRKNQMPAAVSPFAGVSLENRIAPEILSSILFDCRKDCSDYAAIRNNNCGLKELWRAGISGDLPIILVELGDNEEMVRAELCVQIHSKLRISGIFSDLVFVFEQGGNYAQPQLAQLRKILRDSGCETLLGVRGGVHNIETGRFGKNFTELLRSVASYKMPINITKKTTRANSFIPMEITPVKPLKADEPNGFAINEKPFLPWCTVLANPAFGTVISDSALGFTWAVNARENKLTPWYNDTRSDNNGEMLLMRTDKIYNLIDGSAPVFNSDKGEYHAMAGDLKSRVTVTVAKKGCVKYIDLTIKNDSGKQQSGTVAYYTEPVLGVNRNRNQKGISAKWKNGSLILRNPLNTAVPGVMLIKSSCVSKCTCSRESFLSGKWDEYMLAPLNDVCAAILNDFEINPGEEKHFRFTLAWAANESAAIKLSALDLKTAELKTSIKIETPENKLDPLINTWLPQQILGSRMFGRTGFYQCGGAWGFRDQLQDSCAALYFDPDITKQQILRASARQFANGDVLHWWHELPKSGEGLRGVRTLCSDDYLWLPYTVCEYIEKTGDTGILDIEVPFIEGEELGTEHEKYMAPHQSSERATVREHCVASLRYGMKKGRNGLPLMGNGDWNDGMNLVGVGGRGESVWLGMFLAYTLERFACFSELKDEFLTYSEELKHIIDENCWDGEWYLRAFYDDGHAMGSSKSAECQIDSLPQSFSYIIGMPDEERKKTALKNAVARLVDWENGVIKLFDPPFEGIEKPGYIASYNPGLRENGGQYSHAAVWLAMAALKAGIPEGYRLINLLIPANHDPKKYLGEPYALAADIYDYPSLEGRAGWTLYTGSAGWFYRAVTAELFGISVMGEYVEFSPKLPDELLGSKVSLEWKDTKIHVQIKKNSTVKIPFDGKTHNVVLSD